MQKDAEKDFTAREWIVLFGLAALAIAITETIDLSQKWDDVSVFTVVLFSVLLGGLTRTLEESCVLAESTFHFYSPCPRRCSSDADLTAREIWLS